MTATTPESIEAAIGPVSMSAIRALPWAASVQIGTCQDSQERAFTPIDRSIMAMRPVVICSPAVTTTSYSSSEAGRPWAAGPIWSAQATIWLVMPAIAETTTATDLPAWTSEATSSAAGRMRSRNVMDVPPNFITSRDIRRLSTRTKPLALGR